MNETPRTDAQVIAEGNVAGGMVPAEFARQLEVERNSYAAAAEKAVMKNIALAAGRRTEDGGKWVGDKEHWSAASSVEPHDLRLATGMLEGYMRQAAAHPGDVETLIPAIGETLRRLVEHASAILPQEVKISLKILLRHIEPGWDNCRTVVQAWLDGKWDSSEGAAK